MTSPKVFVGCPSSDYPSRTNIFYTCFNSLVLPEGSHKEIFTRNAFDNIDEITKQAIEGGYTHIFFIDDDELFAPDIVMKLLENDVDVVSALYTYRTFPFKPCVFDDKDPLGQVRWMELLEEPGLKEITAAGMGAFLIKTECYKRLDAPYYRFEIRNKIRFGCDILFCEDLRKVGYKIHLDTRVIVGHAAKGVVIPSWDEQEKVWVTNILIGDGRITIPTWKREANVQVATV